MRETENRLNYCLRCAEEEALEERAESVTSCRVLRTSRPTELCYQLSATLFTTQR